MQAPSNNYIKYLNKDIREMMKYSTFERHCNERISLKSREMIPDSVIKQALIDV